MKLILSCEHAGNEVPEEYRSYFADAGNVLNSHRAYDLGALDLFWKLEPLAEYIDYQLISRLLVELNRSLHHPGLFSEFIKVLAAEEKDRLLREHYFTYRNRVVSKIAEFISSGELVMHLSVHSFTPVLNGNVRNTDIGLLYDPARKKEKDLSKKIRTYLKNEVPEKRVRLNYPYLGKADGFTTYLRKKFPENYLGIEIEVNQKFSSNNKLPQDLKEGIYKSILAVKETT